MTIDLHKWTFSDREALMALCNAVDRAFLSDRLPYPYTEADANWWLEMVAENEGKEGVWRAIVVDGQVVGSISVERMANENRSVGSIGYMILTPFWSQGIGTEAVRQIHRSGSADLRDCFPGAGAGAHNRRGVPGEPGIGPSTGEEWLPAGGDESGGHCQGREGDGCEGVRSFLLSLFRNQLVARSPDIQNLDAGVFGEAVTQAGDENLEAAGVEEVVVAP